MTPDQIKLLPPDVRRILADQWHRTIALYGTADEFGQAMYDDIYETLLPALLDARGQLDSLRKGESVVLPLTQQHAEAMHVIAEAFLKPPQHKHAWSAWKIAGYTGDWFHPYILERTCSCGAEERDEQ